MNDRRRPLAAVEGLIDVIPDGIFLHDADGTILDVNQRACDNLGYAYDDLVGEQIWTFAVDPEPHRVRERWVELAPGETEEFEGEHGRRDGTTFPIEAHVARLRRGDEPRYVAIVRDITDQVGRERELERQNERLEAFASTLTHDLRNPLTVAKGRIELVRDADAEHHLDEADRALDRMEQLIDDILRLAREGSAVQAVEPRSIPAVVEGSWQTVATASATLDVDTDLVVLADEGRLQRLFENLFRNAVEHGGEAVTIRVGTLPQGDGIYVEDDGPGIPESAREAVFESGQTTAEAGTGFGLAIVREIAEAHGWRVDVTSGRDGGARFEFTGMTLVED